MIENCTAVILAGGESRRMGRDKAQVEFQGQTLLQRAISNLNPLFAELVVSVRQPLGMDVPQVLDVGEAGGPMMGLVAALEYADTDWVFATCVDMPFVVPEVLQHMAAQRSGHDAVLAKIDEKLQPMPAFYAKKSCLPAMQACIKQRRRSLMRLLSSLHTAILHEHDLRPFDPDLRSFIDFDTPEDVRVGGARGISTSKATYTPR